MANDNGNDYLSQEEIDALLNQSDDSGGDDGSSESQGIRLEDYLSPIEQDALGEIGNISFGSSATALSTLLGKKVDITTPSVSIISKADLDKQFPRPHVSVHVKFVEGFQGINLLVIKTEDAKVIADLMLGGDGTGLSEEQLNDIHISAVQEAMNQMMGSAATSMSTIFNRLVNISPPGIDILDLSKEEGTSTLPDDDVLVTISFRLKIEDLIDSSIMQLLTVPFSKEMVDGLLSQTGGESSATETASEQTQASEMITEEELAALSEQMEQLSDQSPAETAVPQPAQTQQSRAAQQPPPIEQPAASQAPPPMPPPQPQAGFGSLQQGRDVNVQPVEYPQFSQTPPLTDGEVNLNLLMDIPLQVSVELGRTKKKIKEILEFTQGSIIELDKLAGEPVDILVNNKLIAKGEVVVIDENFGVRVTDIVSQADRIQKLQ